ncbi:helix-turn-helix domain-containing protein [Rhodopseudomonas sp. NSM]|uniref:helix-turn-helix domain-containing protein n=1 Tax=Rhodopseudomonas sp. NSM TaxID=3457630 RepID=UPI00403613ED
MGDTIEAVDRKDTVEAIVCLAKMLSEASAAVDDDPATAKSCIARAAMLLCEVQARHATQTAPRAALLNGVGLARWQLNRVMIHIEAHLEAGVRIRDLASLTNLSAGHFARAFRQSVGVPPRNFLIERRVERAKKLMLSTDWPLSEIALACGLSDQAHLSRIFRRYVGITPNAWRREWLEIERIGSRKRCA